MKIKELKELIGVLPDDYEVMYKSDAYDYDGDRGGHRANMVNRIVVEPIIKEIVLE